MNYFNITYPTIYFAHGAVTGLAQCVIAVRFRR